MSRSASLLIGEQGAKDTLVAAARPLLFRAFGCKKNAEREGGTGYAVPSFPLRVRQRQEQGLLTFGGNCAAGFVSAIIDGK
jgi:hypothetical protein